MSFYTKNGLIKLGELIRKNRTSKGLGLKPYAKLVGVTTTTISRLEAAQFKKPTNSTLAKLAPHLGLNLFELIAIASEQSRSEGPYETAMEVMPLLLDLSLAELKVLSQHVDDLLNRDNLN